MKPAPDSARQDIYTLDIGARPVTTPGPCLWAWQLYRAGRAVCEGRGETSWSTAQRAQLHALLGVLDTLPARSQVLIRSGSAHLQGAVNGQSSRHPDLAALQAQLQVTTQRRSLSLQVTQSRGNDLLDRLTARVASRRKDEGAQRRR